MQLEVERAVSPFPGGGVRLLQDRHRRDRRRPDAAERVRHLHHPQAAARNGPTRSLPKAELIERIENASCSKLPGNNYEFTQPIQMRFNELIAGVRERPRGEGVRRRVRADAEVAPTQVAGVLRGIPGAAGREGGADDGPAVHGDQDRQGGDIARAGLSIAAVQDVIGTAIGGREAGLVFEGDRRFEIVVRLPDALRADLEALRSLPVPLPGEGGAAVAHDRCPLRDAGRRSTFTRGAEPDQPRERQAPRRRARPTCAAATSARSWREAQAEDRASR